MGRGSFRLFYVGGTSEDSLRRIHGRDLPGYPASHGCIGLYDEPMQKEQYGVPGDPELNDAKRRFE